MAFLFRPHHFLCALNFQGRGYSPAFTDNFQRIVDAFNQSSNDDVTITVTSSADSICAPCPSRMGESCAGADKIAILDAAHSKALDLRPNQQITWREAKQRISAKISLAVFHQICATCSWKPLGLCESNLKAYLPIQE